MQVFFLSVQQLQFSLLFQLKKYISALISLFECSLNSICIFHRRTKNGYAIQKAYIFVCKLDVILIFMIVMQLLLDKEDIQMFANMDLILLAPVETIPKQDHDKKVKQARTDGKSRMVQLNQILNSNSTGAQNISQQGKLKCQKIAQTLNWDSISLIVVSPLRRCLQTCRQLLKLSKKQIQVSVEPLISAKVSNLQAIGSSRRQLQHDYPQFSFQNLVDCKKVPWYLRQLSNQKQNKISKLLNPTNFLENGIFQDHFQFRLRIQRFQKELKNHLEKKKFGERILIISDQEVFCTITAKYFNFEGKSCSDFSFENGQPNFVSSSQVYHPLSPSSAL